MISGATIVAEARRWKSTPFHHGQALRGVGCDCIGLIVGVADAFRLPEAAAWEKDSRFKGYGRVPDPVLFRAGCAEYLDPLLVNDARIGDILVFSFKRDPMHFGILSRESPRYVIHAYERVGQVVENRVDATFWRVMGAYRLRGVA